MISQAKNGKRDADGEEETGERIHHRFTGEIVLALLIPDLMKEPENIGDIQPQGSQAGLISDVPEDADLGRAVAERKWIRDVRYGDRRHGDYSGKKQEHNATPAPPHCLPDT